VRDNNCYLLQMSRRNPGNGGSSYQNFSNNGLGLLYLNNSPPPPLLQQERGDGPLEFSVYNDQIQKFRRRELRKNQAKAEKILWYAIRGRQIDSLKFHKQYSVGPYILDFFCPQIRLAIELDGEQHKDAKEYDTERERFLQNEDIRVIRFWNREVETDLPRVLRVIKENPVI
jgi:very-short-patch-repair endonuclease